MERPEPNPHTKPYKDRATRRSVRPIEHGDDDINGAAPRTTGQPHHIRQARFQRRQELAANVKALGIDTKGKTLKQIRIAVAKALGNAVVDEVTA